MTKFRLATNKDCEIVKDMINKMYGIEYEVRENLKIAKAIDNKTEVYILAYDEDKCVGFSGASLNNDYYADIITPDIAVIDYICTLEAKDISVSAELIFRLLTELVNMGVKQAIMQVQTYNKQRFFHYALSDKNVCGNLDNIMYDKVLKRKINQIVKSKELERMLSIIHECVSRDFAKELDGFFERAKKNLNKEHKDEGLIL